MPLPGGLDDRLDRREPDLPAEDLLGLVLGGEEDGNVALAARHFLDRDLPAEDLLGCGDDFADGVSPVRPEVDEIALRLGQELAQSQDVGRGQVGDVDVVPDGRSVRGGEVRPVDSEHAPSAPWPRRGGWG